MSVSWNRRRKERARAAFKLHLGDFTFNGFDFTPEGLGVVTEEDVGLPESGLLKGMVLDMYGEGYISIPYARIVRVDKRFDRVFYGLEIEGLNPADADIIEELYRSKMSKYSMGDA